MASFPMSPADAAWFHNDGPTNLAITTGVLLTKKPLEFDKVRAIYLERLATFPRFRQRVIESAFPIGTPYWEDMPQFDIDLHLHHIALAAPYDEEALRALVSDIASTPLDHALPLWQVQVVDDVLGGSALIMRCHHCIADGSAMMAVAARLFDTTPHALHTAQVDETAPLTEPGLFQPVLEGLAQVRQGAIGATDAVLATVANPQKVLDRAAALLGGAGMLLGELMKADDPPSPLKGDFSIGKRVAWSQPVAIKDVKAIGARHGAKVNDVLVAAMTGALRRYLMQRGMDVNHNTIRAMVPVDLRPLEHADRLGNEFGLVLLELAINKARPEQRLTLTKARMDALKCSPEPVASQALLSLLGRVPKAIEDFSNNLFGSKASLVMTNVAGPREVLYLAGVPIDRMLAWAPHPGKQLGMAISILSYQGQASLTVISDARLLPDPHLIAGYFHHEFQTMLTALKIPPKKQVPSRSTDSRRPRKTVKHSLQS